MEPSESLYPTLGLLKLALAQGDESLISRILEDSDLDELLSQRTILRVRMRREHMVCAFLCTLAAANNVSPTRAQLWLSCYQSVRTKKLTDDLEQLSKRNIQRLTVEALIKNEQLSSATLKNAKGTDQTWIDSLELCVDFDNWASAVQLLEARSRPETGLFYRQALQALMLREQTYDRSIHPIHVNYALLARLYETCGIGFRGKNDLQTQAIAPHFQARALERAKRFDDALRLLRMHPPGSDAMTHSQAIARNLCKKGDLQDAIAQMDTTIRAYVRNKDQRVADPESAEQATPIPTKESAFTVEGGSLALQDLAKILNQRSNKMFLVSGTLLGYQREGKLLDHDKDIDVGILGWEEQFEIFESLWRSNVFSIKSKYLKGLNTYYLPILHIRTQISIDIFLYQHLDGKFVTGVDFAFGHRQNFAFTPFDLTPINFLGVDMYIPDNPELNLQENFGNWRVSDPGYISHLESPSTMNKGGLDFMITARLHTLKYLHSGHSHKLRKVIKVLLEHSTKPGAMEPQLLSRLQLECAAMEELENTTQHFSNFETREVACA